MLIAQTNDKRQFLQEMSRGAINRSADFDALKDVLSILGPLIVLILLIYLVIKNQKWIEGKFVVLKKRFSGKPVGGDRYRSQMDVVLNLPIGLGQITRTTTANISPGGMFVKLNPPLERDQIFRFRLNLSERESIAGTAEVMWVQDRWTERFPTGVGVRFKDIPEKDRNRIRLWIQKNRSRTR